VAKRQTSNTTFCTHLWSASYSHEAHQMQRQKRSFLIRRFQMQTYSAVSKGEMARPLESSIKKYWMSLSLIPNSYCTVNTKGKIIKKRSS